MGRISYVQRRGAVYHYRRRLPRNLATRLAQSHFVLSLQTKEYREARRLAARLSAEADIIFAAVETSPDISLEMICQRMREVIAQRPNPDVLGPSRGDGNHTLPVTTPDTSWDLALIFRGEPRCHEPPAPILHSSVSATWGSQSYVARMATPECLGSSGGRDRISNRGTDEVKARMSGHLDATIELVGEALISRRIKDGNWTEKTARQAAQIYALLFRFAKEIFGIETIGTLRQAHLAAFAHFLCFELYKHAGKSIRDELRSIAELKEIGAAQPERLRGVAAPTLNRHLGFLQQLIDFAPSQGIQIDRLLTTRGLRARASKTKRDRYARPTITATQAKALFAAPCFAGCASWDHPTRPGSNIYHRALYWLPLLLYYGGARREEFAGLLVSDVGEEQGIHFLNISPNKYRRLKNAQSIRKIPLHSEILRLGFLDYVQAIAALKYELLFPDLHSLTSRTPLGDRLYDELRHVLVASDLRNGGITIHSLRRAFGNELKQKGATIEERADLLGHAGQTETDERYCDTFDIVRAHETVAKMPIITDHLLPSPIRLLPWVAEKATPPFARRNNKRAE